jgi:hypothetical protein
MAWHLVQTRWGRALLHLAAALRAGHWSWHLAGIMRELSDRECGMLGKPGCVTAAMALGGDASPR